MTGTRFEINNVFDLALVRQWLRKLAEEHRWSLSLRIRAVAAITALTEITHWRDHSQHQPLIVCLNPLDDMPILGIEFHALIDLSKLREPVPVTRWHLEKVCSDLTIVNQNHGHYVVMRVWSDSGR